MLLNLLQRQTDLSLPQVAQLLSVSAPPESQQQLENLSQSLSVLSEPSQQQGAPPRAELEEGPAGAPDEPPEPAPPADPTLSQEDQANFLALLLGQLIKPAGEGAEQADESNGVQSEEPVPRGAAADRKGKSDFSL